MLSIYTEYRMKIVQYPPIPTKMVKYNVGRLNYILSLAETFSAGDWVAVVLMLSQPEIMKVEYHGTDFNPVHLPSCSYVVAGSEHRQSMPMSAEGSSGVSHSKSVARRTKCPPFYSKGQVVELCIVFIPSHLGTTWFLNCIDVMLPTICWVQGSAAHLVSASCAVWHLLGSWLCLLWYSCCQYKQEPRRSL